MIKGDNGVLEKSYSRRKFLFGKVRDLGDDDEGATAIEYGLMTSLIAVTLILSLGKVGRKSKRPMRKIKRALKKANK